MHFNRFFLCLVVVSMRRVIFLGVSLENFFVSFLGSFFMGFLGCFFMGFLKRFFLVLLLGITFLGFNNLIARLVSKCNLHHGIACEALGECDNSHGVVGIVEPSCDTNALEIISKHICTVTAGWNTIVDEQLEDDLKAGLRAKRNVLSNTIMPLAELVDSEFQCGAINAVMSGHAFGTDVIDMVLGGLCETVCPKEV